MTELGLGENNKPNRKKTGQEFLAFEGFPLDTSCPYPSVQSGPSYSPPFHIFD
jgi:hypothetical protein